MATKKDFTKNATKMISAISNATAAPDPEQKPARKERKTYTQAEAAAYIQDNKTSGHKGVKLPRINMAFYPDNYAYIKTMAAVRGETMAAFINKVIAKDLEENRALFENARSITDKYNQNN